MTVKLVGKIAVKYAGHSSPDVTGQRFGRLVAVREAPKLGKHRAWVCKCDCGKHRTVRGESLRGGRTNSCGCFRREAGVIAGKKCGQDLTGKVYGLLTVLRRSEQGTDKKGHWWWVVRCECGKEWDVRSNDVKRHGSCIECGHSARIMAREAREELGLPPAVQCSRCWGMGHDRRFCKEPARRRKPPRRYESTKPKKEQQDNPF